VFAISHADESDVSALATLLEELDRFYGAAGVEPRARREKQIRDALFGQPPVARALVAKSGADVIGLASYSFLWPAAGLTMSLFLKELYVRQERQRQGVGRRLMQELCQIAVAVGCSRVEWQTEVENERARQFYESLGSPVFPGKVFYRLHGEQLRQLAATPSSAERT
jgi:GNAT superfamily N-acetyltransferase